MAPSRSTDATTGTPVLDSSDWNVLLNLAEDAVWDGLAGSAPALPDLSDLSAALRRPAGVFVTHTVAGELNGCIGAVETDDALGRSAALCSWQAAFADPRLPQLTVEDLDQLSTEVSVLSGFSPLPAATPSELLEELRPGVDGLTPDRREPPGAVPAGGLGSAPRARGVRRSPAGQGRALTPSVAGRPPRRAVQHRVPRAALPVGRLTASPNPCFVLHGPTYWWGFAPQSRVWVCWRVGGGRSGRGVGRGGHLLDVAHAVELLGHGVVLGHELVQVGVHERP